MELNTISCESWFAVLQPNPLELNVWLWNLQKWTVNMNFWISFHCTLLLTCYRRDGLLYWHFSPHAIMHLLYVFALSFQKSSLIIPNLIMITCYHDNSLIGPIAHLSLFLSLSLSLAVFLLLVSIFFVVTPTHPSATAITYFNFLTEDSTFFVYLIFFLPSLVSFLCFFCSWDTFSCGKISRISFC